MYSLLVDSVSGRIIAAGYNTDKSENAYILKFPLGSIDDHPDVSQASWMMNELSKDAELITSDDRKISFTPFTTNVSSTALKTVSDSVTSIKNYTSEVIYQIQDQILSVMERSHAQIIPDLPCSSLGLTAISYNITGYNGEPAPSWVSIDSVTGMLTLLAPNVTSDTDFNFAISSSIDGTRSLILKHIKVTVQI